MISPTPGADAASRLFGTATPPDGAGPLGPDQAWPQPIQLTGAQLRSALNPLQHMPVVGMFYRAATGETLAPPLRILGAGLVGGPAGALGAAFMGLLEELFRMGPDQSRPSVPAGMSATGSEAGVQPVTPGTMAAGSYLTLATTQPEFLQAPAMVAQSESARGAAAYMQAGMEYQRAQMVEKGLA